MKTLWTKGVPTDGKEEIKSAFERGAFLRGRLSTILKEKMDAADVVSLAKDGYDCPNWAYKQADTVGYRRAIQEILSILQN